jgi:hypothetical protein
MFDSPPPVRLWSIWLATADPLSPLGVCVWSSQSLLTRGRGLMVVMTNVLACEFRAWRDGFRPAPARDR